MKKLLVLVSLMGQFAFAQDKVQTALHSTNDNLVYSNGTIEVKPEFPGGYQEFYNYIGKNFRTPDVKGIVGKIYVTFVIEKDGSVTDIKVIRDLGYGTGEEAVRVLKNCPKWIPGEQSGKKVRVQYALPIQIKS